MTDTKVDLKLVKEFKPVGCLTIEGKKFFLTSKNPMTRESWMHDFREVWLVIPDEPQTFAGATYYPYAYPIVCSDPLIEYCNCPTIKVRVMDELDVLDMLNEPELPEWFENLSTKKE